MFHTLCQYTLSKNAQFLQFGFDSNGQQVKNNFKKKLDFLDLIKNNFENIKKILNFVYHIEVLCTSCISGKFDLEEVTHSQFENLEFLLDSSEDSLTRKQIKVHDSFSFIRLVQRTCQHVKKLAELDILKS